MLCENCKHERICKKRAMDEYRLTNTDMVMLPKMECRNPHYRSAAPMQLYPKLIVKHHSLFKHGGIEGLQKAIEVSKNRREKLRINKSLKLEQRRQQLLEAFNSKGWPLKYLRHYFCCDFINRGGDFGLLLADIEYLVTYDDKM